MDSNKCNICHAQVDKADMRAHTEWHKDVEFQIKQALTQARRR